MRLLIDEGFGRKTTGEYIQALYIAYGSNCELETQILLSGDSGYIKAEDLERVQVDTEDIERMLKGFIKSLENKCLNPWILESLNPYYQLFRRTKNAYVKH